MPLIPAADARVVANSVLPAARTPLTLTTDDGLTLIGELATPVDTDGKEVEPEGAIVCVHPLPTHGGMMDSHVFRKMAWRLPALANLAVMRFNTRGTTSAAGTSEGEFDSGRGEGLDLAAAIDEVHRRGLPTPWLVGWSFGTDVILKHGNRADTEGAILLSPPLRWTNDDDLDRWASSGQRLVCLVPELDDYLQPDEARERFTRVPQAKVIGVGGARHLWVGEPSVATVLDAIVAEVAPAHAPLPREWHGPGAMMKWSDL